VSEEQVQTTQEEKAKGQSAGESVGKAIANIMDSLEAALTGRGNTVMVRVNDEALEKLDMLVASGICSSRSESAAFLLQRGIESSEPLFERIADVTQKITSMRDELQEWVQEAK
jgi:tRNA(Ser,Leu) C12 N-acetylase TAN1